MQLVLYSLLFNKILNFQKLVSFLFLVLSKCDICPRQLEVIESIAYFLVNFSEFLVLVLF